MTSSNGNIFRVTGPRWIPRTKASDAELWCFFYLRLNKRLSKQWSRRYLAHYDVTVMVCFQILALVVHIFYSWSGHSKWDQCSPSGVAQFAKWHMNGTFCMACLYGMKYESWRGPIDFWSLGYCTGEFPTQRPVTRSFDVSSGLRLNRRLSKQSWGRWFETPSLSLWRHRNVKQQTHGNGIHYWYKANFINA